MIIEKRIATYMQETGAKNVSVLAMDPNNGEILAMATDKTFNLNDPQNLDGWYDEKEQKTMTEEEKVRL